MTVFFQIKIFTHFKKKEDNSFLNINVSENEMIFALKNTKNGLSPGLDELPKDIYKKSFWDDFKNLL